MKAQKKASSETAAKKKAAEPKKKKDEPKQKTPRKKTEEPKKENPKKEKPIQEEPKKNEPKVKLVTISELAKVVGVEIRMIRHFQQQGIIEPESISKSEGNKYNFVICVHSLFKYYREKADRSAEEKFRQLAAKRELEEIKVKRARGELHHTEDIKRIFGSLLSRLHSGFESFPMGTATKVADKTDVMEIAKEIKKQLDKILYEVTNYDVETLTADVGNYIAELEAEENAENDEPID